MSICDVVDGEREGGEVNTHLIFSSELDPNSALRFVLVICRIHQ